MSLLTEIKSLESSFATTMIEAVLKLAKLTDTKMFILLENDNLGRCFGGSDKFCSEFKSGGLHASRNDAEMEVAMGITSLYCKRLDEVVDNTQSAPQLRTDFSEAPTLDGLSNPLNFIPQNGQSSCKESSLRKEYSIETEGNCSNGPTNHLSLEEEYTILNEDEDCNFLTDEIDDIHQENIQAAEISVLKRERDIDVNQEENLISVNRKRSYEATEEVEQTKRSRSDSEAQAQFHDVKVSGDVNSFLNCVGGVGGQVAAFFVKEVTSDQQLKDKLAHILTVEDLERLNDKESVERKVLHSFFYSLGKSCLLDPNFVNSKNVRDETFEEIWSWFPFLHALSGHKFKPRNKPLLFCKDLFMRPTRDLKKRGHLILRGQKIVNNFAHGP